MNDGRKRLCFEDNLADSVKRFQKNAVVGLATATKRAKVKASKTGRSFRTLRLEAERRATLHRVAEDVAGAHVHQA